MLKYFFIIIIFLIHGCASETAKMAHQIEHKKNDNVFTEKNSNQCRVMLDRSENEDLIFNTRIIATPIIGILGIFAAPAILAANASLDLRDRLTASDLSEACGGDATDLQKIAGDVAVNGSIGLLLQGTNLSVYPGGEEVPVSTAVEAAN